MNYNLLQKKYLLLDTNILIYFSKYQPFFQKVFTNLEENSIPIIIGELVKFEFLRGAANPEESEVLKNYLKVLLKQPNLQVDKPQFPFTSDIINSAIEISNIYSWKFKNNKIELPDCMLAAEMKKYNSTIDQLYLATANHEDFPNLFFKRIGIETIDTGDKIFNIGYYKFDQESYNKILEEYKKL